MNRLRAAEGRKPGQSSAPQPADPHGDPLPHGALLRLGTVRLRHGGFVCAAHFSADGRTLTSFGADHTVRTWDCGTGKEIGQRRLRAQPPETYSAAAFSPRGEILALAFPSPSKDPDRLVLLYDTATGKELRRLVAANAGWAVETLAIAGDGTRLAAGDTNGHIHLWDAGTGTPLHCIAWNRGMVTALAFSPGGQTLAAGSGKDALSLWDVATGEERRCLQERGPGNVLKNDFPACLAFAPDGKTLAAGHRDAAVRLWDVAGGRETRRIAALCKGKKDFDNWFASLVFSPDGKTLTADNDNGTMTTWDSSTGKTLRQFQGYERRTWVHPGPTLALAPDGRTLASWGWQHALRLWDTATGRERVPLPVHRRAVLSVAFSPDGRVLASGGEDAKLALWDVAAGRPLHQLEGSKDAIQAVAFATDGKTVAAAGQWDKVPFWETTSGKELPPLLPAVEPYSSFEIEAIAFAPTGRRLALAGEHAVQLWDMAAHKRTSQLQAIGARCLDFSADGKLLAAGSGTYEREGLGNNPLPSDTDVTVFRYLGNPYLWELEAAKPVQQFEPIGWITSMAISPDSKTLAGATRAGMAASNQDEKEEIVLWETVTGRVRGRLPGAGCARFSPDGRLLAAGSAGGEVGIWDLFSGRKLAGPAGHHGPVGTVAFSPDGRRLASGSADTTVLVWDVAALLPAPGPPEARLNPKELEALWSELAAEDTGCAFRALGTLIRHPRQAASPLRGRLRPVAVDPVRVGRLVKDLDDDRFSVRSTATTELANLGELAKPALLQVQKSPRSLEVRQRVRQLLRLLGGTVPPAEIVRGIRAVEALEHLGTPEARQTMSMLAEGEPAARLTQEAKASLERLAKRGAGLP
jgi:WD40 repeat protein